MSKPHKPDEYRGALSDDKEIDEFLSFTALHPGEDPLSTSKENFANYSRPGEISCVGAVALSAFIVVLMVLFVNLIVRITLSTSPAFAIVLGTIVLASITGAVLYRRKTKAKGDAGKPKRNENATKEQRTTRDGDEIYLSDVYSADELDGIANALQGHVNAVRAGKVDSELEQIMDDMQAFINSIKTSRIVESSQSDVEEAIYKKPKGIVPSIDMRDELNVAADIDEDYTLSKEHPVECRRLDAIEQIENTKDGRVIHSSSKKKSGYSDI